jgi:hypothetical protein
MQSSGEQSTDRKCSFILWQLAKTERAVSPTYSYLQFRPLAKLNETLYYLLVYILYTIHSKIAIPFPSILTHLKYIQCRYLQNNKLSGSVPRALLSRSIFFKCMSFPLLIYLFTYLFIYLSIYNRTEYVVALPPSDLAKREIKKGLHIFSYSGNMHLGIGTQEKTKHVTIIVSALLGASLLLAAALCCYMLTRRTTTKKQHSEGQNL